MVYLIIMENKHASKIMVKENGNSHDYCYIPTCTNAMKIIISIPIDKIRKHWWPAVDSVEPPLLLSTSACLLANANLPRTVLTKLKLGLM